MISILEKSLFAIYNQKNINFGTTEEQLNYLKTNEWPILDDYDLLTIKKFENNKNIIEKITSYLKQLTTIGIYRQLWNDYIFLFFIT